MLNSTYTWSHARGNAVVPSRWQATFGQPSRTSRTFQADPPALPAPFQADAPALPAPFQADALALPAPFRATLPQFPQGRPGTRARRRRRNPQK
jgi:hypothetical protein